MNFKNLLLAISLILSYSISAQSSDHISNIEIAEKLKNYELDSHNEFQIKLNNISENYFADQSSEFISNELGFFRIWSEALKFWQSDFKKKNRWKPRVEKYFKTTTLQNKIQEELNKYTKTIYEQRVELLNINANKQFILANKVESIHISSDLIQNVVSKVEKLAINEVVSELGEISTGLLILYILSIIVGIISKWGKIAITLIVTVVFIGYNIYKTMSIEESLENAIIEFTTSKTNNIKLEVKPTLIEDTNQFYYALEK